ncbi:MAG: hypothetical protein IPF92_28440 [Myxococcales bacterium]|jgi:hypothetical protein|nr:hypothetical protein [Myxococcales bacterium]
MRVARPARSSVSSPSPFPPSLPPPLPSSAARVLASAALVLAGLGAGARVARADILPDGKRALDVAVTFTGAIDSHIVAYPTDCMGLDTKLNPHLEYYQDYDVLEQGAPRAPYKFCNEKTRVWALDSGSFKKSPGEKVPAFVRSPWKLDELTRVRTSERGALFRASPHIHATGYSMPAAGLVDEGSPLAKVEEVVTFGGLPPRVQGVRLTYRYKDGPAEEHKYTVGSRPQPLRAAARDWMAGLVDEKPDAGASEADAGVAPARLDRKLPIPAPPPNTVAREAPLPDARGEETPQPARSRRFLLALALAAAVAAAFALRESGARAG